jgi:aspartate aminotransferase-like enzyme/predicted N-acetyltransferase YhbS
MTGIQFKEAETPHEIDQIHRLNHQVFAEEIGQHSTTADGHLIDRFHDRNRYFIACKDGALLGMVSVHDGPDFSIASRLSDAKTLHSLRAPLEVRLLAILPEFRDGSLLAGLFWQVNKFARDHGYSDLLISGIVERQEMYAKLGFRAMGPAVACGAAQFVPMRLSLESPPMEFKSRLELYGSRWQRNHALSLLPGPVEISNAVARAFHAAPVSHRSKAFVELYEDTRARLGDLMGGMKTAILGGSGTLANDVVAANLRAAFGNAEGLVLANGEFGERLVRQARRAGLSYRKLRCEWGEPWSFTTIEEALEARPAWIWAVHLETSTGVLNDLPRLIASARARSIPVAADCVSSLGAENAHGDGSGRLFLASGVSGKALGSYAGLSFIFVSPEAIDRLVGKVLCPSFDLIEAVASVGPMSTVSSPLVSAVCETLRENYGDSVGREARYAHYRELGRWTRAQIREAGLAPLASEEIAAPTVTTFVLPSAGFARRCLRAGFRIAHESDYLRERGWGQIATMGNLERAKMQPLFEALRAELIVGV